VPKRTIDELLETMEVVQLLKEAVRRHDTAIEQIVGKLDLVERRLAALEGASPETSA
jgi:hypothetical protein